MGIFLNRLGVSSGQEYRPDVVVTTESFMYEDYVDDYTYAYADLMETMSEVDPAIMGCAVTEAAGGFAVALKAFMSTMLGKIIAIIGIVLAAIIAFIAAKKGGSSGGSSDGSSGSGSGTANDKPKKDDDYVYVKGPDGKTKKVPRSEIEASNKENEKRKQEEAERAKREMEAAANRKKAEAMCRTIAQKAVGKSTEILKSILNEKLGFVGVTAKILSGHGDDVIDWLNALPTMFSKIHDSVDKIRDLIGNDMGEIMVDCNIALDRIRSSERDVWVDGLSYNQLIKYVSALSDAKNKFDSKYETLTKETDYLKSTANDLKQDVIDVDTDIVQLSVAEMKSDFDKIINDIKTQCGKLQNDIRKTEDCLKKLKDDSETMTKAITKIELNSTAADADSEKYGRYSRAERSEDKAVQALVHNINLIRSTYQEYGGKVRKLVQSTVTATVSSLSVVKRIVDDGATIKTSKKYDYCGSIFNKRFPSSMDYAKEVLSGVSKSDAKFIRETLSHGDIRDIFSMAYRPLTNNKAYVDLVVAIGEHRIRISSSDFYHAFGFA